MRVHGSTPKREVGDDPGPAFAMIFSELMVTFLGILRAVTAVVAPIRGS
jgi:hypothetical protein